MAFFRAEGSMMVSWLRKNGFFLRIFFFWGPICYKNSKIPQISIYAYLTISMSSSTMCRSRNSWKLVVGVAGFEIPELYPQRISFIRRNAAAPHVNDSQLRVNYQHFSSNKGEVK